jgi:hypothetical protein
LYLLAKGPIEIANKRHISIVLNVVKKKYSMEEKPPIFSNSRDYKVSSGDP